MTTINYGVLGPNENSVSVTLLAKIIIFVVVMIYADRADMASLLELQVATYLGDFYPHLARGDYMHGFGIPFFLPRLSDVVWLDRNVEA